MSASRTLPRLLVWDVKLQARENVYLFTVLTTLAFSTVTPSHSATGVACKARSSYSAWAVTRVGSPCPVAKTP